MPRRDYDQKNDKRDKRDKKDKKDKKERFVKKRVCRFCRDAENKIDYKDGRALGAFISERGRIMPRRITGNCAFHQRQVVTSIKRARIIALIPFSSSQG